MEQRLFISCWSETIWGVFDPTGSVRQGRHEADKTGRRKSFQRTSAAAHLAWPLTSACCRHISTKGGEASGELRDYRAKIKPSSVFRPSQSADRLSPEQSCSKTAWAWRRGRKNSIKPWFKGTNRTLPASLKALDSFKFQSMCCGGTSAWQNHFNVLWAEGLI